MRDTTQKETNAGLTPTDQHGIGPTVELEGRTVTDVWWALLESDAVRDALIRNVRAFAEERTLSELYDALEERDVPYWLRSWVRSVARGDRRAAWRVAVDLAPKIGTDTGTVEDLLAVASLFDAGEVTPTLSVEMGAAFRDRRRDQRADVCRLLATLADGCDVRIVSTRLTRRWLAEAHRSDLPGVSEWCNDHRGCGPVSTLVDDALATLDPDGTAVEILRRIAEEPAETLPYGALHANPAFPSDSAIRQHLATLSDLGLVEPFGPDADRKVELLEAGRVYLDTVAEEIGTQQTLEESVSGTPKSHSQAVLSQQAREGGKDGEPYRTAYLDRANHAAAAAVGGSGDVILAEDRLDGPIGAAEKVRYVSFDEDRGEVVTSVRATGALQHMVSVAVALASPRLVNETITEEGLDAVDEPPAILRGARQIGGLSEDALDDAGALREAFIGWGEDLEDMTTDLRRGAYEDRDRFRGEILRSAQGLAGSLAHLYDVFGFDLAREVRVPGGLEERQHREIARSTAVAVSIQSRYGAFGAYRQLFEPREDKRDAAFSPEVDAADPTGTFIGSVVFRGPDIHRLRPSVEAALEHPTDLHEDAPEFVVPVTVAATDRRATAEVTTRILSRKRLRPTRAVVSLLDAVVSSPYAVARALNQLGEEPTTREVRPRDVRYALATCSPTDLLADLPPTLGKVLAVLCRTEERLTQREVADRADVSTQSVRTHRETLATLGLVEVETGDTVRFGLSIAGFLDVDPGGSTGETGFREAVDDVAAAVLPPGAYADPDGPVFDALSYPPDPWILLEEPTLGPWVKFVARLVDADPPDGIDDTDRTAVEIGPTVEQTPVAEAGDPVDAVAD